MMRNDQFAHFGFLDFLHQRANREPGLYHAMVFRLDRRAAADFRKPGFIEAEHFCNVREMERAKNKNSNHQNTIDYYWKNSIVF
jgi:hypothetical protein